MGVLTEVDTIGVGQTITVTFRGILGPFTGATEVEQRIKNAFAGTNFTVESVTIPLLSEIEPPVVIGHMGNAYGSTSLPGRNITVREFEQFFLSRLGTVDGLYEAGVNKIETGAVKPSLTGVGAVQFDFVLGVILIVVIAVIVWKIWPARA